MTKKFVNQTTHDVSISSPTGGTKIFRPGEFSYDSYYSKFVGPDRLTAVVGQEGTMTAKEKTTFDKDVGSLQEREALRLLLTRGSVLGKKISVLAKKGIPLSKIVKMPDLGKELLKGEDVFLLKKAQEMVTQGKTFAEIAKELDLNTPAVAPVPAKPIIPNPKPVVPEPAKPVVPEPAKPVSEVKPTEPVSEPKLSEPPAKWEVPASVKPIKSPVPPPSSLPDGLFKDGETFGYRENGEVLYKNNSKAAFTKWIGRYKPEFKSKLAFLYA